MRYSEILKEEYFCTPDDQSPATVHFKDIEVFADKLFAAFNIDVSFTKHFYHKLKFQYSNQTITSKPNQITTCELKQMFEKAFRKHGAEISKFCEKHGDRVEAVLRDIGAELNMPFILTIEDDNGAKQLITKSIIRKQKFATTNQTLDV